MSAPVYEDFRPGDRIVSDPLTVDRDAIVAFAHAFDPQPFHLDEAAAESTFVGKLIASGWQTAALGMRLLHASVFRGASTLGSPGIDELRWMLPVVPGDSLVLKTTVEDCRASASKPGLGFVRFAARLENGAGRIVMTQGFSVMFGRRGVAPPPPRPVTLSPPAPPPEPDDAEILDFIGSAEIGRTRDLGPYTFTPETIVAFARAYDPQEFHLDAEAAARTHFGGLCASGWHTAAAYMKRLTTTRARDYAYTAARGPAPMLGPSPGFRKLRWLKPVYAGDTIRYRTTLTDRRASASRPGWGLAFAHNTGTNQHGEEVFRFDSAVFAQWEP